MRHRFVVATIAFVCFHATALFEQPGTLVIVGGGNTGKEIVSKALTLAGGRDAIVAVLPQASAETDAGDSSVKMWLEAGAHEAVKVRLDDPAAATATLKRATLIWFPGGDQNRLMKAIDTAALGDLIRERYRAGATVGGTSAGAAVMSELMITGEADLQAIAAGKTQIAPGLALWPDVIVDQHFVKRQRASRLISAILDHPDRVGVGIDESTAVIVHGSSFDVIGRSSVVVLDGRHAEVEKAAAGAPASGRGLTMSVLHEGQSYSLK